jgi:hypothetical protein
MSKLVSPSREKNVAYLWRLLYAIMHLKLGVLKSLAREGLRVALSTNGVVSHKKSRSWPNRLTHAVPLGGDLVADEAVLRPLGQPVQEVQRLLGRLAPVGPGGVDAAVAADFGLEVRDCALVDVCGERRRRGIVKIDFASVTSLGRGSYPNASPASSAGFRGGA